MIRTDDTSDKVVIHDMFLCNSLVKTKKPDKLNTYVMLYNILKNLNACNSKCQLSIYGLLGFAFTILLYSSICKTYLQNFQNYGSALIAQQASRRLIEKQVSIKPWI